MKKNFFYLTIIVSLMLSCTSKNKDIFANPDNGKIEAADGHTKLYVPTKKITFKPGYHWFAYYDKLQCDPTGRYVLSMKTTFEGRSPVPTDTITIGMIDLHDNYKWIELGKSCAWGWQQGCQLQFIPGSKNEILWNDREGDKFVSHIVNIETGKRRTIPCTVYCLSPDGKWAITTDYRRLNETRPGYGYSGIPDPNRDKLAPENSGIWKVDLKTGEAKLIISIAQIAAIANPYDVETAEAKHRFEHLLISPDGKRLIFLHRWQYDDKERTEKYLEVGGWGTRMLTASVDGSDIRIIDPYNYTSHFIWRDASHILAWTQLPKYGEGFFLFEDSKKENIKQIGKGVMIHNGHCTYLPGTNNEWILNDTYPDKETRLQSVYLYHVPTGKRVPLGDFYSPEAYKGEWRCDTHPRSTIDGQFVIVDSPNWEGRQEYLLDIRNIISNKNIK